jgi:glycosyltransferase involved in cell wall biosynthesis
VFQNCNIEIIPNGLNTTVFKPYPKVESRKLFELPQDVPLILFGAVSPLSNPRKGFSLIRDATQAFATMTNVDAELVIFGDRDQSNFSDFPLPMHSMGYITNEERLAKLYSAADIMVVPSKYEGFGQTVTESMASGTPVVAFDTTGPSDIIDHKETGYLAEPYNPKDLATGIEFLLNDDHRLDEYSENARTEAVNEYHYTTVAKQYLNLYRSIV